MNRAKVGKYVVTKFFGEEVSAFIPAPLPPDPPLDMSGTRLQALEEAALSLGQLEKAYMVARTLPTGLLVYWYIRKEAVKRKEAVLSSQIEGIQSSLADLLTLESGGVPRSPESDVGEVANYMAAFDHGLARIRQDSFPLSNRLIREMHGILLGDDRPKTPGEFRRSQVWIGGTRPGNAIFVPPPATEVEACMSQLERFLHDRQDGLPLLVRAGLAHLQFETIHPFLDGNGRVGRMLIPLMLCQAGFLQEPILYLSLYLKENRNHYFYLLNYVRETGDWERWVDFFLEGITVTAQSAIESTRRLVDLVENDRVAIRMKGRRSGSLEKIHEELIAMPITSISILVKQTGLTFVTVSEGVKVLIEMGMLEEITGQARNRLFRYNQFLDIINEGTDTPLD